MTRLKYFKFFSSYLRNVFLLLIWAIATTTTMNVQTQFLPDIGDWRFNANDGNYMTLPHHLGPSSPSEHCNPILLNKWVMAQSIITFDGDEQHIYPFCIIIQLYTTLSKALRISFIKKTKLYEYVICTQHLHEQKEIDYGCRCYDALDSPR